MDPLRIIVRIVFGWLFVLILVRLSGKRTVHEGDASSFVVAIIVGDMFDDLFWAEVPAAEFAAGVGTLILLHLFVETNRYASGARDWLRIARGRAS